MQGVSTRSVDDLVQAMGMSLPDLASPHAGILGVAISPYYAPRRTVYSRPRNAWPLFDSFRMCGAKADQDSSRQSSDDRQDGAGSRQLRRESQHGDDLSKAARFSAFSVPRSTTVRISKSVTT